MSGSSVAAPRRETPRFQIVGTVHSALSVLAMAGSFGSGHGLKDDAVCRGFGGGAVLLAEAQSESVGEWTFVAAQTVMTAMSTFYVHSWRNMQSLEGQLASASGEGAVDPVGF